MFNYYCKIFKTGKNKAFKFIQIRIVRTSAKGSDV